MGDRSLYDEDILAWSEQQATALRRLAARGDLPNELDLAHIVEEIEDVGHGELRDARDLLQRTLVQLVVAWAAPDGEPDWQWTGNIVNWLSEAALCLSPSMHELVALEELWTRAVPAGDSALRHHRNGNRPGTRYWVAGVDLPFQPR